MTINQTQFAYSLTFACADENKRLGATLVNSPMKHGRSKAELMNLSIISKTINEILIEEAETFQSINLTLEIFGAELPAKVYFEVTEDLSIYHVIIGGIDVWPLMLKDAANELLAWVEEELKERQAQLQYDMQESKDGTTN